MPSTSISMIPASAFALQRTALRSRPRADAGTTASTTAGTNCTSSVSERPPAAPRYGDNRRATVQTESPLATISATIRAVAVRQPGAAYELKDQNSLQLRIRVRRNCEPLSNYLKAKESGSVPNSLWHATRPSFQHSVSWLSLRAECSLLAHRSQELCLARLRTSKPTPRGRRP